jgi:N-acyl-D-aspartate/D-glutamate deacylase
VVIFDYDTIKDVSTYDNPVAFPEGIDYVLVNGVIVVDHGTHTGARPGKVLYGPADNSRIGRMSRIRRRGRRD